MISFKYTKSNPPPANRRSRNIFSLQIRFLRRDDGNSSSTTGTTRSRRTHDVHLQVGVAGTYREETVTLGENDKMYRAVDESSDPGRKCGYRRYRSTVVNHACSRTGPNFQTRDRTVLRNRKTGGEEPTRDNQTSRPRTDVETAMAHATIDVSAQLGTRRAAAVSAVVITRSLAARRGSSIRDSRPLREDG